MLHIESVILLNSSMRLNHICRNNIRNLNFYQVSLCCFLPQMYVFKLTHSMMLLHTGQVNLRRHICKAVQMCEVGLPQLVNKLA